MYRYKRANTTPRQKTIIIVIISSFFPRLPPSSSPHRNSRLFSCSPGNFKQNHHTQFIFTRVTTLRQCPPHPNMCANAKMPTAKIPPSLPGWVAHSRHLPARLIMSGYNSTQGQNTSLQHQLQQVGWGRMQGEEEAGDGRVGWGRVQGEEEAGDGRVGWGRVQGEEEAG